MDNLARTPQDIIVDQQYATVINVQKDRYLVQTPTALIWARPAASCLIRPRTGDQVLVCRHSHGPDYILAVLETASKQDVQLEFDGNVKLSVPQGRLNIAARDGVDLATSGQLRTVAGNVRLNTMKGDLNIHDLAYQGSVLNAQVDRLRTLAGTIETFVDRWIQRARRIFRNVEDCEQVRAGRADWSIKRLFSLRSRYTIMTAGEDVKIDGERIHIG